MQAGEHDDDLVTGVGGLADQSDIVACLPRLDVAHDQAATIPGAFPGRVLELRKDFVSGDIESI